MWKTTATTTTTTPDDSDDRIQSHTEPIMCLIGICNCMAHIINSAEMWWSINWILNFGCVTGTRCSILALALCDMLPLCFMLRFISTYIHTSLFLNMLTYFHCLRHHFRANNHKRSMKNMLNVSCPAYTQSGDREYETAATMKKPTCAFHGIDDHTHIDTHTDCARALRRFFRFVCWTPWSLCARIHTCVCDRSVCYYWILHSSQCAVNMLSIACLRVRVFLSRMFMWIWSNPFGGKYMQIGRHRL